MLLIAIVVYFIIGLSITAFCVHMSYHEAAVGFGDSHDAKAQRVLESKIGPVGFIFLFTFWPIALFLAFFGPGSQQSIAEAEQAAQAAAAPPPPPKPSAQPGSPESAEGRVLTTE